MSGARDAATEPQGHVRVAIVEAGFAGVGMAATLRRAGVDEFVVLERAPGVRRRRPKHPGRLSDPARYASALTMT